MTDYNNVHKNLYENFRLKIIPFIINHSFVFHFCFFMFFFIFEILFSFFSLYFSLSFYFSLSLDSFFCYFCLYSSSNLILLFSGLYLISALILLQGQLFPILLSHIHFVFLWQLLHYYAVATLSKISIKFFGIFG